MEAKLIPGRERRALAADRKNSSIKTKKGPARGETCRKSDETGHFKVKCSNFAGLIRDRGDLRLAEADVAEGVLWTGSRWT